MAQLKNARKIQRARRVIQALLVALVAFLGWRHQFWSTGSPIDAYCPLGGVESLYAYITTGKMLPKTGFSNFILLGSLLAVTFVAGGVFCGWLCPLGTVQDWIYRLRQKIVKNPIVIPKVIDQKLRYLKYVVLALIVVMTIRGVTLWFAEYDPFKVLFHFSFESTTAYVVLGLTLLSSLLIERFWCKYLCPLGALLSPLAKIGLIRVKKTETCAQCNLCLRSCSMGLNDIGELGCTNCLECVTSCPTSSASTTLKVGPKRIKGSHLLLPVAGILLGIVLVSGSMGIGVWQTKTAMSRVAVSDSAESLGDKYPPVETITGMTTLEEVAKTYDLTPEAILKQAGLDSNQDPKLTVKNITKAVGKETEVIREAVEILVKGK